MANLPPFVEVFGSIGGIRAEIWDGCAEPGLVAGGRPQNPFVMHAWFDALERSGSAVAETGWAPCHLQVLDESKKVIGVMPLYVKSHSMGEYVFDHGWAEAFAQVGGRYYPKLQGGIPFTPVTGPRFLIRDDCGWSRKEVMNALVKGAHAIADFNHLSSVHIPFCTEEEWSQGSKTGLLKRESQQLHWKNDGYADFDGFLAALSSRKRKQVRRERAAVRESGLVIETLEGDDIRPEHWDIIWAFYQNTGARKWGIPYLTRTFFEIAQGSLRQNVVLFLARDGNEYVAGALNVRGRDTLFGRYWGCLCEVPFLHFELCYYRAIEYAIEHGIAYAEAGAGGEHKAARGYEPVRTHSLHWIVDDNLRAGVARFLSHERVLVDAERLWHQRHSAYRRGVEPPVKT